MSWLPSQIWDEPWFVGLPNLETRVAYCYLFTCAQPIPGLKVAGPGTVAEAIRVPEPVAKAALHALQVAQLIEFDPNVRLIRIPNLLDLQPNPLDNYNVLEGWRRRWIQQIPESPLKHRHVDSIYRVVEMRISLALDKGDQRVADRWKASWEKGFGALRASDESRQGALFHNSSTGTKTKKETVALNGFETVSKPISKQTYTYTDPDLPDPDLFPESGSGSGSGGEVQEGRKPARSKLPFSISQVLASLQSASAGRVIAAPFDKGLAKPCTAVLRQCAEQGVTLEDVRLAGEWLGAGGLAWMSTIGPSWLAKAGNLCEAVGAARQWKERGRPSLKPSNGHRPQAPRGLTSRELVEIAMDPDADARLDALVERGDS